MKKSYYIDEMECPHNPLHKIVWWYEGIFCLTENKYVDFKLKLGH